MLKTEDYRLAVQSLSAKGVMLCALHILISFRLLISCSRNYLPMLFAKQGINKKQPPNLGKLDGFTIKPD